MKSYLSIYLLLYVLNLISLHFLLKQMFGEKLYSLPLMHMVYHIIRYSKLKALYYGLAISLTGLPLFIFFFVKFSFLIKPFFFFGFFYFFFLLLTVSIYMFFSIQPTILNDTEFETLINEFSDVEVTRSELSLIIFFFLLYFISIFFFPSFYLSSNIPL